MKIFCKNSHKWIGIYKYRKSQYNKCGYSPQSHLYIQCNTGNNKGSTYDSQQEFYRI